MCNTFFKDCVINHYKVRDKILATFLTIFRFAINLLNLQRPFIFKVKEKKKKKIGNVILLSILRVSD